MAFPDVIEHEDSQINEPITWQPETTEGNRKELTLENFKLYDFTFDTPETFHLGKYQFKVPPNTHLTVYDFSLEEDKFMFKLVFLDGSEEDLTFDIIKGVYSIQGRGRRLFEKKDVL